jgi:pilus assembly protein Flp/PilA
MVPERKAKAQGLVEYALIILLVALIVIIVLVLLAPPVANIFSNIVANI